MRGSEFVIMAGPVHDVDEYETTPCDVEKLALKPGQAALTGDIYQDILNIKGNWQWKVEWEVLPNR